MACGTVVDTPLVDRVALFVVAVRRVVARARGACVWAIAGDLRETLREEWEGIWLRPVPSLPF